MGRRLTKRKGPFGEGAWVSLGHQNVGPHPSTMGDEGCTVPGPHGPWLCPDMDVVRSPPWAPPG